MNIFVKYRFIKYFSDGVALTYVRVAQLVIVALDIFTPFQSRAKLPDTSSETIQAFCYDGSSMCEFFLAWPDWPALLTPSHEMNENENAGLAPAFFLCTLPTFPAKTSITNVSVSA